MEIFKENKLSKWKHILKKLRSTKIADNTRLETINKQLEKNQNLTETEVSYLEEKYNMLKQFQTYNENGALQKDENKTNSEHELKIIEQLHQKEIGDFSRLESIRNYLIAGQPMLLEDSVYLKEQYEQLRNLLGLKDFSYEKKTKRRVAPLGRQAILIDKVEPNPTHDFDSLGKTISKLIVESTPHFTIGIYGEWGTGKTTLMKSIESNLLEKNSDEQSKVFPIWFNAWKHERDEGSTTISLLKTVAYAIENHKIFDDLSKTIFKGLTIVGKDLMQQIAMQVVSKNQSDADKEIDEKMDYLKELYRDSVYYEGIDKIINQMEAIREQDRDYRIVIFIDDLDRCSANKALEVLESIKLFLDIEGFVFVIGLSHKTVTQLISHAYKATGVKGEDYIKKIIQIPIKIPSWSKESVNDLIEHSIIPRLNSDYTKFLSQNASMVAKVTDYNPRQLKRFINNVIIAFETFASKTNSPEIQFNEIFLAKILKSEWPEFYQEFVHNKDYRDLIKWMTTKPKDLRKYFKYLTTFTEEFPEEQRIKRKSLLSKLSERSNGRIDSNFIDILTDFDNDTWIFLDNIKDVLFGIEDWKVIGNVMGVVEEFSYNLPIGSNKSKNKKPTSLSQS